MGRLAATSDLFPAYTRTLFAIVVVSLVPGSFLAFAQELPIQPTPLTRAEPVDFATEIFPLLNRNCLACHHSKEAEGGLVLETYEGLLKGGDAAAGIVPGDVDASYLFARVSGQEEPIMPPDDNGVGAERLTPQELALLQLWIQQGAPPGANSSSDTIHWQSIADELQPVYALAVSPDGRFVASGKANQVVIYDAAIMRPLAELADPELSTDQQAIAGRDIVQSIAFSPDGQTIATGGYRTVRLWTRADGHIATSQTPFANAAGLVAVNAEQSSAALVNAIGDIEIWDLAEGVKKETLQGHTATIRGLSWADAGNRLISIDDAGTLVVWQPNSGSKLATVETNKTPQDFAVSRNGEFIALTDIHGNVHLWKRHTPANATSPESSVALQAVTDAGAKKGLQVLLETKDATSLTFVPQQPAQLAVATAAGKIHFIDLAAGSLIRTIDHQAPLRTIALGGEPLRLVTAAEDGTQRLWDVQSGKAIIDLEGDPQIQLRMAAAKRNAERQEAQVKFLSDRKAELEKSAESEAAAFAKVKEARDTAKEAAQAATKKLDDAQQRLTELEASIQENTKATAAAEETLKAAEQELADTEASAEAKVEAAQTRIAKIKQELEELTAQGETNKGELEKRKKAVADAEAAHTKSVQELAKRQQAFGTSQQANQRAAAAVPEQQRLIELEHRRSEAMQQRVANVETSPATSRQPFSAATFLGEPGDRIAMARADGTIRVIRASDGSAIEQFQVTGLTPQGFLLDDEDRLLVFGPDGPAWLQSLRPRWELQRTIGGPNDALISDRVTALDFHPQGGAIAVGSGPPSRFGEVKIFAVHNGQLLRDWGDVHSDSVFGVAFSPAGRRLASSAADKTIRLLDVIHGETLRSLEGHTHHVLALAWQDDGRTIASASADQTVKVWNVETGEQRRTITGFPNEITALTFVGQTSQIATACADGQVRLHDIDNGKAIRTFNASGDFLFTADVTQDAQTLVAAGQSGVLRSWSVDDGKLQHEVR